MTDVSAHIEALAIAEIRETALAGRAQAIRERAHLSQLEVAAAIGASRSAVSSWEQGRRLPRGDVALRYLYLLRALEHQLEKVPA